MKHFLGMKMDLLKLFITGIAAPGTSGGPWLNTKGEILGLQVAGLTVDGKHQGVNKVVAIEHIKNLLLKIKILLYQRLKPLLKSYGDSPQSY